MKGIFELRPALPRYKMIWDLSKVYNFFRQPISSMLSLRDYLKSSFSITFAEWTAMPNSPLFKYCEHDTSDKCVFHTVDKVKQTRGGIHLEPLGFIRYTPDNHLLCHTLD